MEPELPDAMHPLFQQGEEGLRHLKIQISLETIRQQLMMFLKEDTVKPQLPPGLRGLIEL